MRSTASAGRLHSCRSYNYTHSHQKKCSGRTHTSRQSKRRASMLTVNVCQVRYIAIQLCKNLPNKSTIRFLRRPVSVTGVMSSHCLAS